jgi:tetratricopeptide (TPR) repeat protein/O-antigen ligase
MNDSSERLQPSLPVPGWSGLLWPSVAVFVGFSWLPLSYYRMVGWPWILLWQAGFLALLIWVIVRLRQFQRPFHQLGHGFDGWLLALAGVLVVSSLRSPFPRVALLNASLAATYGLGLYAYRNWVDRGWLTRRRLWLGLVIVAAGVALISLALWRPTADLWQSQNFVTAIRNHQPLGHHNFVGGYLGLMLPLAVAAALSTSRIWRWGAAVSAGLITVALYVSGSRGAALGLVLWLLVTWLCGLVRTKRAQRWRWGLMGLVPLGGVGLALATNPRIRGWFSNAGATDGPTLDRWFMLRLGGNILRDRPLVGVGPGVMSRVSNLYRPIETGAGLDHIQQLHNTPVQLAGELGLPGLLLYLAGIFLIGRLWWRLWRLPLTTQDRYLLGGIGGAFLAYGVSSLTDYQLENIPIAGTLAALVVLLICVADAYGLPRVSRSHSPRSPHPKSLSHEERDFEDHFHPPSPLGRGAGGEGWIASQDRVCGTEVLPARRRLASLAVWAWVGLLFYLWLPFSLTVGFGAWADGAFYNQNVNLADTRWHKATLLSPWDPTAAAVASESLYGLDAILGDSEAKDNVRALVVDYAQQAQAAAPNDVWFNQNLAVLYQPENPAQALPYAQRAVQLMPRNRNHGYWLLGELLLATGQASEAIAAFTLEALVNPESLTYPLWEEPPLQALYPAVVAQTLAEYDQFLTDLDPQTPGYSVLYETRALLGWWVGQPLESLEADRLRPLVNTLLLADTDLQAALAQLESQLADDPAPPNLLLAAWLDPATHWPAYTKAVGDPLDLDTLRLEDTLDTQPLRAWLTSLPQPPDRSYRGSLTFAYRNIQASQITQMLAPPRLETHLVLRQLSLFQPWPREFPALDHRLGTLQSEALGLILRDGFSTIHVP